MDLRFARRCGLCSLPVGVSEVVVRIFPECGTAQVTSWQVPGTEKERTLVYSADTGWASSASGISNLGDYQLKRTAVHLLAAGLLLSGASLIQAQSDEPAHLMRIFREDIKSGKGAAHERVESAYVRAFSKTGYPSYLGLENITGSSQAWFIERYDKYESIEKAIRLTESEPLKATVDMLDSQDGELRSGEREMIAVYQPNLSYLPIPPNLPKM